MNAAGPPSPYARIGGEPVVRAIVERFYDLLETEPAYADLRALHAADLGPVRNGLTHFLVGWLGGPRDWFERGQCVMSLHRAFPITPALAEQWALAMTCAITAQEEMDGAMGDAMAEALGHMARGMINFALKESGTG